MFGLRRIGKSTLRQVAREHFANTDRPCAYIDAQGAATLTDFLLRMSKAMPDENSFINRAMRVIVDGPASTVLAMLTKGEEIEDKTVSAYWQLFSRSMEDACAGTGPKPILIVDEFTFLIENLTNDDSESGRKHASDLLASMRLWRDQGMTMLLSGSIGFIGLARNRKLNIDHLNDLDGFDIPELSYEEALEFIDLAAVRGRSGKWTKEHTQIFLDELRVLYPSFLVLGLQEVNYKDPCAPEEIPKIFEEVIRPKSHNIFFEQFNRRFKQYAELPRCELDKLIKPAIRTIFSANSRCSQSFIECDDPFTQMDLNFTLSMLEEDGFLKSTETREGERFWAPSGNLAALWWKRMGDV